MSNFFTLDDLWLSTGDFVTPQHNNYYMSLRKGVPYEVVIQDYGSKHNKVVGIINDRKKWITSAVLPFERVPND